MNDIHLNMWFTLIWYKNRDYLHQRCHNLLHYNDVIMGAIASQITGLTIVYSTVFSDADHRKHQSSASLAFVRGIRRGPVNFTHKWSVTRKMLPFDDVIMAYTQKMIAQSKSRRYSIRSNEECILNVPKFKHDTVSLCVGLWRGITCQRTLGYAMKLKHSRET